MEELYRSCVHHLAAVHRYPTMHIDFDYDGYETWFCASPLVPVAVPLSIPFNFPAPELEAVSLFEIVGVVSEHKAIEGPDEMGRTSFWIECRNQETISRTLWGQALKSLIAISEASGIPFRFSKIYEIDAETGSLRLRINSVLDINNVGQSDNPILVRGHLAIVPSIQGGDMVLGGETVSATFFLVHREPEGGQHYLEALLFQLSVLE